MGIDGAQGSEAMERELVQALAEGRLPLYYQPCVDLRDGRVVAVEALLRLVRRDGVLVPPNEFIPVAERSGLIVPIGADVIGRSVAQAAEWREKFGRPVRVWINLAAPQLAEVDAVVRVVVDALERHHATPDLIGLEVTESMLMENIDSAVDGLRTLRRLGVEIALDDFGTGHSSLSYLRQLPVTVVKVDRSFVSGIGGSLADAAIVEAVIELAHTLGLAVVAEGAETVPQVRELQALGAERAQGFLFSRPARPRELEPLLTQAWCGLDGIHPVLVDHRADGLPGAGGPRARLLLTALDAFTDAVEVTDCRPDPDDDRVVYVNPAFERQTGYRLADVLGARLSLLDAPPGTAAAVGALRAARAAGEPVTVELMARRVDGTLFPVEVTASPVHDGSGVVTNWLHICRDLTLRHTLERERATMGQVVEAGRAAIFLLDPQRRVAYANVSAGVLTGLPASTLVGVPLAELFAVPVPAHLHALAADGLITGVSERAHLRHVGSPDKLPVELEVLALADPVTPFAVLVRDLRTDDRRRSFRDVLTAFAERSLAAELTPDAVRAEMHEVLEAAARLLGVDAAALDLIDQSDGALVPTVYWSIDGGRSSGGPKLPHASFPQWFDLLDTGDVIVRAGGDAVPEWLAERLRFFTTAWDAHVSVPLHAQGRVLGVVSIAHRPGRHREWQEDEIEFLQALAELAANLLDRQQALDDLRRRELELSSVLDSVSDVILAIDATGAVHYANPAVSALGQRPDQLVGVKATALAHPEDESVVGDLVWSAVPADQPRVRLMTAGGAWRWFELSCRHGAGLAGVRSVLTCRDVDDEVRHDVLTRRRNELQAGLLRLSQEALASEPPVFVAELCSHLGRLVGALGADYAFVDALTEDGRGVENLDGWSRPEHAGFIRAEPRVLGVDDPWHGMLARLEPVIVTDQACSHGDHHPANHPHGGVARAFVTVPFVVGGSLAGLLSVGSVERPRNWTDDEVSAVRLATSVVAAVLERDRMERVLRGRDAMVSEAGPSSSS